jgi:hypothetical protein
MMRFFLRLALAPFQAFCWWKGLHIDYATANERTVGIMFVSRRRGRDE